MVISALLGSIITAFLDWLWPWFWANVNTISSLVIIGGAIVTTYLYFHQRSRHPRIVMVPEVMAQLDVKTNQLVEGAWVFGWTIYNRGRVTAEGVRLTLHLMDSVGVDKGTLEDYNLTIFEGLDIVPEWREQELPIDVRFFYVEGEEKFTHSKFAQGFVSHFKGKDTRSFGITRTDRFPNGGYILTFHFSGHNLTDADRVSKSWSVTLPEKGTPSVRPFTRPPPHEEKGI